MKECNVSYHAKIEGVNEKILNVQERQGIGPREKWDQFSNENEIG